jgi:hypothetical protein
METLHSRAYLLNMPNFIKNWYLCQV